MKYNSIGEQLIAKAKELDPNYKPDKFNDMSEAIDILLNNSGGSVLLDIEPYLYDSKISQEGYNLVEEKKSEIEEEAKKIEIPEKTVLIAQTTFSPVEFEKIASALKQKNPSVQIFNSICSATMERQNALKELEGKVDAILVIGGKNSANTRRLFETASLICGKTALIEDSSEIPDSFFSLKTVGLTAGASTPDFVIDEVERALLSGK